MQHIGIVYSILLGLCQFLTSFSFFQNQNNFNPLKNKLKAELAGLQNKIRNYETVLQNAHNAGGQNNEIDYLLS